MNAIISIEKKDTARNEFNIFSQKLSSLFPAGIKRVLFINPPESTSEDFNQSIAIAKRYPSYPPYGAGILNANIKARGYISKILDLNFFTLKNANLNHSNFNFNAWENHLKSEINIFNPDLICISVMFTMAFPSVKKVVINLSNNFPSIPIISGGVAVSNDPENFLRNFPEVALVGLYEGDVSLPDLLDCINGKLGINKVTQVAFLHNKSFYTIKDRSTPSEASINTRPDYGDLPIGDYSKFGAVGAYNFFRNIDESASTILSNRGCRARCSFCSVRNFNGLRVRSREVKSVVDEMEFHVKTYGIKHFMWLDDDLLKDQDRVLDLFSEIKNRNLNITWDATNGLIAAAFTEEIMKAAVESGCIGFNLGLESGNDEILRKIHKPGNVKQYFKAKEIFSKYPKVFVKGFTILGFPNETIGQIKNTISIFQKLEFHWYPLQLLTPLAGTEIALQMIEQGLIDPSSTETAFRGSAAGSKSKGGGKLREREQQEKHKPSAFTNILDELHDDHIPTNAELEEIWFIADYKLNYEKILSIKDLDKLSVIKLMLDQITDDYTIENAMGNLFLGYINSTLGNHKEAHDRFILSKKLRDQSQYWQKRFDVLNMNSIYDLCNFNSNKSQ